MRLTSMVLSGWVVASLTLPAATSAAGEFTDVIVQIDGSTEALVDFIRAQGGTVHYQYRNVNAVAARVPAERLHAVARFRNVTQVEKDSVLSLPNPERAGRPMIHEVLAAEQVALQSVGVDTLDPASLPQGYANFALTGAAQVWEETAYGEGSVVAVVDTGTVPNACLWHAVIGAPGFPNGYNASGDGVPPTDPANHYHGTHVGGAIASACALDFSAFPGHPLYQAIAAYLPWDPDFVPIFGQAPGAKIYPVKVFPQSGGGAPTSVILDGLDHLISLKRDGVLDIDIVNLSLGGGTLFDGLDSFDRFVLKLWQAGIVVVAAAGNNGPTPNTVGSPATAYNAIVAGALDYGVSSRVLYEYLGLAYLGVPGQGLVMRPDNGTRVANFSSRGPLSDGRAAPDICALGVWNFQTGPTDEIRWAGGTSFASPTVAGGAALLNAYWENQLGYETWPYAIRGALSRGADDAAVGDAWQDFSAQGHGVLDVPAALARLQSGNFWFNPFAWGRPLRPNILKRRWAGPVQTYESDIVEVHGGEMVDYVLAANKRTSRIVVEITDMVAEDNGAYAFWPNALEINIQSAKRTDIDRPVAWLWYPQYWGDSVTYIIEDGPWLEESISGTLQVADQPMEPGMFKVTLGADYSNETPVSYKVRITRENLGGQSGERIARETIRQDDSIILPVEIPEGVANATFDLSWYRDWSRFPTSDLDMFVYDPEGFPVAVGATLNAPESAQISNPEAGIWYVEVSGYEVHLTDVFSLYLTLE